MPLFQPRQKDRWRAVASTFVGDIFIGTISNRPRGWVVNGRREPKKPNLSVKYLI
jgi:hypothetical protein